MKLRNQKSVPFLGKNLPKRTRKTIKNPNEDELPFPANNSDAEDVQFYDSVPDLEDVPTPSHNDDNDFLPHNFSKISTPLKKFARGSAGIQQARSTDRNLNSSSEDEENNLSFNFSQCKNQSDILEGILKDITNRSNDQGSNDAEDFNEEVENSDVIEFLSPDKPEADAESNVTDDYNDVEDGNSNGEESHSDDDNSHPLASRSILERLEMSVQRFRDILNGTNDENAENNDGADRGNSTCNLL